MDFLAAFKSKSSRIGRSRRTESTPQVLSSASAGPATRIPSKAGAPPVPAAITDTSPQSTSSLIHSNTSKARNELKPFIRLGSDRKNDELKILSFSYVISESPSLCLAINVVSNLIERIQVSCPGEESFREITTTSSDFIKLLVEAARKGNGNSVIASDPMILEFVNVVGSIDQKLQLQLSSNADANDRMNFTDKSLEDLQAAISKIKNKYPILLQHNHADTADTLASSVTRDSSSILGKSIGFLKILKEAAGIAPVPFLRGAIGTALVLLEMSQTTRGNRDDMIRLAGMAGDFVASIRAAWEQPGRPESRDFQLAINNFTEELNTISHRCQVFGSRPLLSRIVNYDNDKDGIADCQIALEHAIRNFNLQVAIIHQNTLETLLAAHENVMAAMDRELLERLPRPPLAFSKRDYLPSSRTDELAKIIGWIESSTADKRVFWLSGGTGMGKTTLSSHLRDSLRRAGRLAACFFFSRNDKKQEDPGFIIEALAYQLAQVDQDMANVICKAIRSRHPDQQFSSQFQAWVLNPLLAASFPLPMVIIFDALDEYKDIVDLLDVMTEIVPKMPRNIRILFTSRPDAQIQVRMRKLNAVELGLYPAAQNVIETFFRERLRSVEGWRSVSPAQDQILRLVDAAKGHFMWAATACSVVANPSNGYPDDILEQILSPHSLFRHSAEARLDSLYHGALSRAFPDRPEATPSLENYRRVLGAILVVEVRLNISNLQAILGRTARVDAIVSDLRSLQTQMPSEPTLDRPVTPASERFHASFLDFIADPQRCTDVLLPNASRYRIDLPESHMYVALACLQRMNEFFDSEQGKAELFIDSVDRPQYAFDYWAIHVYACDIISDDLRRAITDFSERNLVHWLRIQIRSFCGENASDFIPNVDPGLDAPGRLHRFGVDFRRYADYGTDVRQLDVVISVQGVAMGLAANDHPRRDEFIAGMGIALLRCYQLLGRMSDLDTAIKFYREALLLCPVDHPRRCNILGGIANALRVRYDSNGALGDLNESISMLQESLEIATDTEERYSSVCRLAFSFYRRYEKFGSPEDLKDAVAMTEEASAMRKPSAPTNARLVVYKYKYRVEDLNREDLDELDSIIIWYREWLPSNSTNHAHPYGVYHLAQALHTRFKSTGDPSDLDEAIHLLRDLLETVSETHSHRRRFLSQLISFLQARWTLNGKLDDSKEAAALQLKLGNKI